MNGISKGYAGFDKSEPVIVVPESLVMAGLAVEGLPLKVWLILKRYAGHKGDLWVSLISLKKIAGKVDRSVSQVSRAIGHLEKIGLVVVTQKQCRASFGVYNEYALVEPKVWWKSKGQKLRAKLRREKGKKWQGADERARVQQESQEDQERQISAF